MTETTDTLRLDDESRMAMPPSRTRWERVQLNARVRAEVGQVLARFVRDHDTTVQSCVDLAIVEFLAARGYPLPGPLSSPASTRPASPRPTEPGGLR